MVSDSFQGGCVCENAAGLRLGTDNVEIAALAAPRPMKLVGATGDWTARTMTNAFPSLQVVYAQIGATDRLEADVFDFPHNYNQTSRERRLRLPRPSGSSAIDDPASTREGDDQGRGRPRTSSPSTPTTPTPPTPRPPRSSKPS